VDELLGKHPYLGNGSGGKHFGGADLAWCALVGWIVLPGPNFHRGLVELPDITTFPQAFLDLHKDLLNTPAGTHCVRCYSEHRLSAKNSNTDEQ
jgi:hypothetical protein